MSQYDINLNNRPEFKKFLADQLSFCQWVAQGAILDNRYFDIHLSDRDKSSIVKYIEQICSKPKQFKDQFLEIGSTNSDEKICIYIGDGIKKGQIFLYGWQDFNEYYSYDSEGNAEYHQDDVYGFRQIAKNFTEFFEMLYSIL